MIEREPRIYVLPTMMTAGNILSGFVAILQIFNGREGEITEHYYWAIIAILAACLFDVLDGRVARLGGQESPFGRELDSIADIVSFGVAPALLVQRSGALKNTWVFNSSAIRADIMGLDLTDQATDFPKQHLSDLFNALKDGDSYPVVIRAAVPPQQAQRESEYYGEEVLTFPTFTTDPVTTIQFLDPEIVQNLRTSIAKNFLPWRIRFYRMMEKASPLLWLRNEIFARFPSQTPALHNFQLFYDLPLDLWAV